MSNSKDGGPAFPVPMVSPTGDFIDVSHTGMSLRDYFAAKIAQGDAAAPTGDDDGGWSTNVSDEVIQKRVAFYFRLADAMVAFGKRRR